MEAKWFEIRDRATFVPALAISIEGTDGYLARRAGFSHRCIQLVLTESNKTNYDPYNWGGRTYPVAHQYMIDHWDELEQRDVIDVEFILGETSTKKLSEDDKTKNPGDELLDTRNKLNQMRKALITMSHMLAFSKSYLPVHLHEAMDEN